MDLDSYYRQRVDEMHRVSELHFRRTYQMMHEMQEHQRLLERISQKTMEIMNRNSLNGDVEIRQRPKYNDAFWKYFGTLALHDQTDDDFESELSWLVRDIQTHISPRGLIPRSSRLRLCFAALQQDDEEEGDIYAFYAVSRTQQ